MFPDIAPVPLLIAFAANFLVGGIWYAAFANPWMREAGLDRTTIQTAPWPMPAYLVAAVGAAIQAAAFALIAGWARPADLGQSLLLGAIVGLLAAFATGKHHAFGRKSWLLFAIDGGNDFVGFVAMGLVFGLA